jgi:hypothetical protein
VGNQDAPIALAEALAKALLITFAYGLPALVAVHRRHDRSEAIALLNLLLGWTVLGWLVLLAWALRWTPRRSRLWRRLAGRGRDGARRAAPGSIDHPDGRAGHAPALVAAPKGDEPSVTEAPVRELVRRATGRLPPAARLGLR